MSDQGWVVDDEQWDSLDDETIYSPEKKLPNTSINEGENDHETSSVFEISEPVESTVTQEDYELFLMSQASSVGVSYFFINNCIQFSNIIGSTHVG
jgi:hypothetical protein